jgi:FixJ family two-component response regulator
MSRAPANIFIVDDDRSFRMAVGDLLSACGYRVSLYESAEQLLEAPPGREPGCILLDVQMIGLSGPQLQDALVRSGCQLPIVFLSGHDEVQTIVQTIKSGAEDFLKKPIIKETLLAAIERGLERYRELQAREGGIEAARARLSQLTPRERDVFAQLIRGKPHKQIAHLLGVSERTVKLHRHSVMQKFQIQSLAELAVIAERLGLLSQHQPRQSMQNEAPAR